MSASATYPAGHPEKRTTGQIRGVANLSARDLMVDVVRESLARRPGAGRHVIEVAPGIRVTLSDTDVLL
jgi:hypothetical protein